MSYRYFRSPDTAPAFLERGARRHRPFGGRFGAIVARVERGLGEVTEDDVRLLLDVVRRQAGALAAVRRVLERRTYRCPGDHWSRRLTEREREVMERWERHVDWDRDDDGLVEVADTAAAFLDPNAVTRDRPELEAATWILRGQCQGAIEIALEQETGDYGTVSSWPVASGPCAEALRLDEDEDYCHPIWHVLAERASIRGEVERATIPWGFELVHALESQLVEREHDLSYEREQFARVLWAQPREC